MKRKKIKQEIKKPYPLFDYLRTKLKLLSDVELADALKSSSSTVSRVRYGDVKIPPAMVLFIHSKFKLSIKEIQKMTEEKK